MYDISVNTDEFLDKFDYYMDLVENGKVIEICDPHKGKFYLMPADLYRKIHNSIDELW